MLGFRDEKERHGYYFSTTKKLIFYLDSFTSHASSTKVFSFMKGRVQEHGSSFGMMGKELNPSLTQFSTCKTMSLIDLTDVTENIVYQTNKETGLW